MGGGIVIYIEFGRLVGIVIDFLVDKKDLEAYVLFKACVCC